MPRRKRKTFLVKLLSSLILGGPIPRQSASFGKGPKRRSKGRRLP